MAAKPANADEVVLALQERVSGPADRALGALARLENQIGREQRALGRLETDLSRARDRLAALAAEGPKSAGLGVATRKDTEKYNADLVKQERLIATLTDRIGSQKDKLGKLGEDHRKLANPVKKTSLLSQELSEKLENATRNVTYLGAVGGIAGMALTAAFAVVSASLMTVIGLFAKAVSSSGEMREEFLTLQAASVSMAGGFGMMGGWLWNGLRASTRAATEMQGAIDKVSGSSARSRAELAGYATQLYQAWFRGKQLDKALQAVSTVASATDGKLTDQAMSYMKQLRFMGLSVDAIADRIEKKFGGVAREKALSLDKQMMRLGQNLKWIFGGADIAPLLRALDSVLRLFNSNTESAHSMRDAITWLTEKAIGLILRLGIVLLKTYNWLREHDKAWRLLKIAFVLAGVGAMGLALGIVALVGILGGLALALEAASLAITGGIGLAIAWVTGKVAEFLGIGRDMMTGLAAGIRDGAEAVWNSITNVVQGAIDKANNLLQRHSPPKVFVDMGRDSSGAFASGLDDNQGSVSKSATSMVQTATGAAKSASGGSGGNQPNLTFENCNFFGDITEDKLRQMLARILESARWGGPQGAPA